MLDDGNTDDGSINFCYGYASANKDEAGVRLACAMLQITEAERDALYANRWQVPALPLPEGDVGDVGDSRVLTPDALRTIVERHAEDCACSCGADIEERRRHKPSCAARADLGPVHADRGALLGLLRTVLSRCNDALPDDSAEHYNALRDIKEMLEPLAPTA